MDGLEPEEVEEGVGEGGGGVATKAASQHVAEGGGSMGVKVGRKRASIAGMKRRKRANKLKERAYPCTFTGKLLGEGVVTPEFLDEDGGSESSKGTGKVYAAGALQSAIAEMLAKEGELGCKVSITIDMWTAPNNKAWLVVIGQWIDENFQLRTMVLEFCEMLGRHGGREMAQVVEETVVQWGLEGRCIGVTTDNTSSNIAAFRRMSEEGGGQCFFNSRMHFRCLAHVINLAVQAALSGLSKTDKKKVESLRLTDADWETLQAVKTFLSPFAKVSKAAEGAAYPTVSMVVTYYNNLIDAMESRLAKGPSPTLQPMIVAALSHLKKYAYITSNEYWIATFLDPSMKAAWFDDAHWEKLHI
ncbi:unnamed protein product [Closterium sp. Naga37s-1]|nr:unnamed protein product [Closterium sp. Naga37s-1]